MARIKVRLWYPILLPTYKNNYYVHLLELSTKCLIKVPHIRFWLPTKTHYRLRKGNWKKVMMSLIPGYALISFDKEKTDDWDTTENQIGAKLVYNASGRVEHLDASVVKNLELEESIETWDVSNLIMKIGSKVHVKRSAKSYPCAGCISIFLGVRETAGGYFAKIFYKNQEYIIPLDFLEEVTQ